MEYSHVHTSDDPSSRQQWQTGFWRRMPWIPLCCILGALLGLAASISIVASADGVPISDWRYSPTVYLSISYTITNILIAAAFGGGVTISWWRKAMGRKTELGDLHRYWSFATNPVNALSAGKKFNYIAFASLLVALTPINGPLLQRSSSVVIGTVEGPVMLQIQAAPSLHGNTSYRGGDYTTYATLINERYRPIAQSFYDSEDIRLSDTGCKGDGVCNGTLRAAGFAVNCSSYSESFMLVDDYSRKITCTPGGQSVFAARFFSTWPEFSDGSSAVGVVQLQASYKYSSPIDYWSLEPCNGCMETLQLECNGSIMTRTCSINAATVQYPVVVDGNRSTITLDPVSTIWDDVVDEITAYDVAHTIDMPMGGVTLALSNRLNSNATLSCSASNILLDSVGTMSEQFVKIDGLAKGGDFSYCDITYDDPIEYMLSQARALMFRTAMAFGNASTQQNVFATQVRTSSFYHSNYGFLAAAAGLTMISILIVITTFNGFWTLGRTVSMSPLEIAKAFDASLLAEEDSNAKAEELVKSSGKRRVRYRQVQKNDTNTIDTDMTGPEEGRAQLGMFEV